MAIKVSTQSSKLKLIFFSFAESFSGTLHCRYFVLHMSNSNEYMRVNEKALHLHVVYKKPDFYYKLCKNSYQVLQVTSRENPYQYELSQSTFQKQQPVSIVAASPSWGEPEQGATEVHDMTHGHEASTNVHNFVSTQWTDSEQTGNTLSTCITFASSVDTGRWVLDRPLWHFMIREAFECFLGNSQGKCLVYHKMP